MIRYLKLRKTFNITNAFSLQDEKICNFIETRSSASEKGHHHDICEVSSSEQKTIHQKMIAQDNMEIPKSESSSFLLIMLTSKYHTMRISKFHRSQICHVTCDTLILCQVPSNVIIVQKIFNPKKPLCSNN